jgi:hypothetical protein
MRLILTLLVVALGSLLAPSDGLALQVHAAPEGLYSHQLAHCFFIVSMAILAFWLQKRRLVERRGWRYLQISCLLFIIWNIDAFVGHTIEFHLSPDAYAGEGWARALVADKAIMPYLYYLLKMDHVICVPAIFFLYLGLRWFRREEGAGE